ncbi:MAG: GNAT family N-acetyltransferase [Mucilaginibacter polytrichastri]|nr:GNAT family N-acetyltransferase [Mucilaginibacter polytrichastri]
MITIREAAPADAKLIRTIAEDTWWPAYSDILSAEQIRFMLDEIYETDKIATQILSGEQTYILLCENGTEKGFAAYSPRSSEPDIYKLHKIYCLPETRGKGFGRILIDDVAARVQRAGKAILELNVNRFNPAKSFYEKMGFTVIYEEDIPIGPYFMNDFVMRKELGAKQ